jgi:hypothetical protein
MLLAYLVISFLVSWWFLLIECREAPVTGIDVLFSGFLAFGFHLALTPILFLFLVSENVADFINFVSGK